MKRNTRPKALVVEDDQGMQEALHAVLDEEGYSATTVGSVEAARAHLRDVRPKLLLLDLELEGSRGDELLEELSRRSTAPPTVVVSGDLDAKHVARRFDVACVTKPSGIVRLTDEIESSVESHRRPRLPRESQG